MKKILSISILLLLCLTSCTDDKAVDEYKNVPLTFVGHSLCAGEAALASIVTGSPAVLYNPAGLSQSTLTWLNENGYGNDTSKILQYNTSVDWVHVVQVLGGVEFQGQVIQVDAWGHSIESVINGLRH